MFALVQVTVPFEPMGGLVQLKPELAGTMAMLLLARTMPAGSGSVTTTFCALLGPLLVTVSV